MSFRSLFFVLAVISSTRAFAQDPLYNNPAYVKMNGEIAGKADEIVNQTLRRALGNNVDSLFPYKHHTLQGWSGSGKVGLSDLGSKSFTLKDGRSCSVGLWIDTQLVDGGLKLVRIVGDERF